MAEVRLNLLLMGKMGVGKSSSGNTILGQKCFKEYNTMAAGTKHVHCATGRFEDYVVSVVDAPGLMDTEIKVEEREERAGADMFKALIMCGGEIDAFVLVLNYTARFTDEDRDMLEILKIIFGEHYFKHLIVVLTHGDSFVGDMENAGTPNKSFDTWVKEQKGPFKQLFTDCKRRFILFNNREKDAVKMHAQRQKLIQLVKYLQRNNGKYTSETFEDAKELRETFILEQKIPLLQKNILATMCLLITDIQRLADTPEDSELEHIKQGIENLQNEIQMVDKGTMDYQQVAEIVAHLQENLHNTTELRRLAQELHAVQISEAELLENLSRAAFVTFVLTASVVGAPIAVLYGVGTVIYAIASKIQSNLRFKRTCTKITEVVAKMSRSETKTCQ
ncbi:hypothetical protein BsWGS_23066 [Bradybaena similaris]